MGSLLQDLKFDARLLAKAPGVGLTSKSRLAIRRETAKEAAALGASYLPALRATRIDPMVALQGE